MKTKISSLNEALAFLLQGLYFTEAKLKTEFSPCISELTSGKIKREIQAYIDSADDKMFKLERVFNYLMTEPLIRQSSTVNELMEETRQMLASASSSQLRDILIIGCLQNINAYKISNYRSAYMFAVEMELDTATDLLREILAWEIETRQALSALAIDAFNQTQLHKQNR